MIIKNITMNNFRQYKGKHTVDFSVDPERNVTLILGQNTSGKTTIIQAFKWVLYGETDFKKKEVLLNYELIKESDTSERLPDMYVEVELIYNNRTYLIRRLQTFTKLSNGDVKQSELQTLVLSYIDDDGKTVEILGEAKQANTINEILPQGLMDFFFFAGEHINELNDKKNVEDSVRTLMGLDVLSNAVDHFDPKKQNSVISKLKKQMEVDKKDEKSGKWQRDLEIFKRERTKKTEEKDSVKKELEELKI